MVIENKYHTEVIFLYESFGHTFIGRIIENESGKVVCECEDTDENFVNAWLKLKLEFFNNTASDKADSPDVGYYQQGGIECKEYLEAKGFAEGFYRGSAIKYITRAGKKCKDTEIQDLEKARDFINFEIERLNKLK